MRLLLIEDDEMIGKSIREGLRRESYGVDWVRDGGAAEQSQIATDYDLLILDLGLPRAHGLQVLKNSRQKGKKVPVLIITARDGVEDRVRAGTNIRPEQLPTNGRARHRLWGVRNPHHKRPPSQRRQNVKSACANLLMAIQGIKYFQQPRRYQ